MIYRLEKYQQTHSNPDTEISADIILSSGVIGAYAYMERATVATVVWVGQKNALIMFHEPTRDQ